MVEVLLVVLILIREVLSVFSVEFMFRVTLVVPLTCLWCVPSLLLLFGRGLAWPTWLTDLCRQLVRRWVEDLRECRCLSCLLTVVSVLYVPWQVVSLVLLLVIWLRNLCRCVVVVTPSRLARLRTTISLLVTVFSIECGMDPLLSMVCECLEVCMAWERNSLLLLGLMFVLRVPVMVVVVLASLSLELLELVLLLVLPVLLGRLDVMVLLESVKTVRA